MTRPMHQDAAAAAVLRRTMVLLLLLLMFSLSSFPSVTADCPYKCICYEEHNVDCSKKDLDRIPDRIPPDIESLDLSHNEIRDIEPNSFIQLTKLKYLNLAHNVIRDIEPKSFTYLIQLKQLDLAHNEIRYFEPNSFTHLTELCTLNLQYNKISNLKIGAFANLSKLQKLNLQKNNIENIKTGVFNNLTSLEYLTLNGNKIHKLDLEMFKGLTKLISLDLSHNEIRDIEPNSFIQLTKLEYLNLAHNVIRDIEPKLFTHLTELRLDNNKISNLKIGAFANLSKFQILFLHDNDIENIETGVFNNLKSLKWLTLNDNKIHKLDLEMFKGLTKLDFLYLQNNKIRNIPPGIFDSLTRLSKLIIDGNPLTCDCNMKLFVNGLKKNYPHLNFLFDVQMSCYFPVKMRQLSLKEINETYIHCTSPDIIVVPENKTVSIGEQLQLSCEAVGDPEPFITWAKDDINLELGQRVQVFQNNTLIISKVEKTDGGQYKCVASNHLGRKSFEAMVNVNDKCPPLESDSLGIKCTHNGKYANCSNPSMPGTIAKPLCKPLYTAPNGYENEPLELRCQSNGTWNKELYRCNPNCGKTYTINDGIIMGGKPARSAGTAPWNVGVYRFETISNNYNLICGGSIISPNLVVSAAHCFWKEGMLSNIISVNDVQYMIAVGKYSRNITIIDNEFTKIMNVETVYLNEYYYGNSEFHADDIAIVVLRNRISFSLGVSPICVDWTGRNTIPNGAEGKIAGWGKTEKDIASPILLEASLPYIDHSSCRKMCKNGFESFVTKDKFCAGSALGQGVDLGDSGAGLNFLHSNNLYYLTGVASVKDQNTNNSIAVFTDVRDHIEFISRVCNITHQCL